MQIRLRLSESRTQGGGSSLRQKRSQVHLVPAMRDLLERLSLGLLTEEASDREVLAIARIDA
jgi:hypothetical protein